MDYIYRSFEKQYLQYSILRILIEEGDLSMEKIPFRMMKRFSSDNIEEIVWERPFNVVLMGVPEEMGLLIKLGFVTAIDKQPNFRITDQGIEIVKQTLINPQFSEAYIQWRSSNMNQKAVEMAKASAKWSKNAAIIAMVSTIIMAIISLIDIFTK